MTAMLHVQEIDYVVAHYTVQIIHGYLYVYLFTCIYITHTCTHRIDIYIIVRNKYIYFDK